MAAGVTSTTAPTLLHPKRFLASTADPPLLIVIRSPPIRISHGALRLPSPAFLGSSRFTPVRCRLNRSGGSDSPLNSASEFYGRREGNWFVVMDKPGGEGASRQEMTDCFVQTLAGVVGSEEEAKKKIYMVLCEGDFGFGCVIDEEMKEKIKGLAGVRFVFHDPYAETGIDELKHSALGIETHNNFLIKNSDPIEQQKAKRQLERAITLARSLFWVHKDLNSHHQAHWNILTQMDQVLYELSLNLKALWEETSDILKDSDIHRIEQAENAIESLSLAASSLRLNECKMLGKMGEKLRELSTCVGQLRKLPIKEACASNSVGSSLVINLKQFRRRIIPYQRHVRDCAND